MGPRKVLNGKSDLQGHSWTLAVVAFNRPHTIFCWSYTATMSLSCTVSEILSLISQNLKRPCDSGHIPFVGRLVVYHSCASTPLYQSAHNIWSA